ncbi:hypothetical protein YC2023_024087 [Brassica napus]
MHLQEPQYSDGDIAQKLLEYEVEKRSAFVLGLLALKRLSVFPPEDKCSLCLNTHINSKDESGGKPDISTDTLFPPPQVRLLENIIAWKSIWILTYLKPMRRNFDYEGFDEKVVSYNVWLLPFLLFHCLNQIHHLRVKDKPSFGKSVNHCIVHFPIWLYTHFLHSIEKSKYLIQVTLFRIAKYHTRIRHYILLYVYICHLHPDTFSLLWAAYHIIPSVENNVEIFSVKRIHILVTVTKYAGPTSLNAAVTVAGTGDCGCGWLQFQALLSLEPAFDFKRFKAVCMIVSKRCQPLTTAKAVFAGRSGETSKALKQPQSNLCSPDNSSSSSNLVGFSRHREFEISSDLVGARFEKVRQRSELGLKSLT